MISAVRTLTPVVYVSVLGTSVSFYRLLGFDELLHGDDGEWAWSYLRCAELTILLAAGGGPLEKDQGPVQLYCQADDVAVLQEQLQAAQLTVEHLGYPDHAPGGEIRVLDPDRHVVMVAQTAGARPGHADGRSDNRSSILQQAAEAVRLRGVVARHCEVGEHGGRRCPLPAEVKLADTWGDSVWSCLPHADEVLFTVRAAYLASEDGEGLGPFLSRRRARAK